MSTDVFAKDAAAKGLPRGEEAVGDASLVEDLDGARVEAAGAHAHQLGAWNASPRAARRHRPAPARPPASVRWDPPRQRSRPPCRSAPPFPRAVVEVYVRVSRSITRDAGIWRHWPSSSDHSRPISRTKEKHMPNPRSSSSTEPGRMRPAGTPSQQSCGARGSPSSHRRTSCAESRRTRRTSPRSWRSARRGPVVLVGHSYGGFVITNAVADGSDVQALVYVDAFVPDEGETVFQILGGSGSALDVPDPTTVLDLAGYPGSPEGDLEAFLKADTVHNSFAQDLDGGRSVADRREPAADHPGREHHAVRCRRVEGAAELGSGRHRGPGDPAGHPAQHGGTCGGNDHRGGRFARLDGVQPQVTVDAILAAAAAAGEAEGRSSRRPGPPVVQRPAAR